MTKQDLELVLELAEQNVLQPKEIDDIELLREFTRQCAAIENVRTFANQLTEGERS